MSNVSKKKLSLPTVQQPAARWAFVLAVCASLGVVVSYYWRVFYGLDARGVSAAGVTGLCVGLAVLAGACYSFCVYFTAEPGLIGQNPALYQNVSRLVQFWL